MEESLQNRVEKLEAQVKQQAETLDELTQQLKSLQASIPQHPSIKEEDSKEEVSDREFPPAWPIVTLSTRMEWSTPTDATDTTDATTEESPKVAVVHQTEAVETDWEHLLVRVWLPRIFIIVLLIGLLYGFIAAANAGLLIPELRCLIGVALGALLLLLGERQLRAGRTALGQVLLGGSISALVITTFSAHMLYDLISTTPAFALQVLWIAGGVLLAERHRSQALAILASLGGYLVPFLVKDTHPNTTFFVSYEVLLAAAFLWLSTYRSYHVHYLTTSVLFHVTMFIFFMGTHEDQLLMAAGIGVHHLILLSLLLTGRPLSQLLQVGLVFSTAALTMAWWFGLLHDDSKTLYTNGLLGFAILYFALFLLYRQDRQVRAPLFFSIAALSTMFYLLNQFSEAGDAAVALMVEAVCSLWVAYSVRNTWQKAVGVFILFIGGCMAIYEPIREIFATPTLDWIVLLVGLAVYGWLERRDVAESAPNTASYTLYRALSVLLAGLLLVFMTQVTDVLSRGLDRDGQHMAISFLWMFYALGVIVFGFLKKSRYVRLGGVIMLFLTLGKLVLVDLPIVSMMVRAFLMIAIGALGLLISRLFYTKNTRS
ncbi:DUF2339 domain-containing protein [Tumebacillus permanentifrigoris]|uniref:Putative membrane protein DUF2339 n=1 Tax=Tumebacillus permanentifrigoris TaxID=378543 RepID=A0A316D455_9BACL|nr:DUF2339 domain-containing protein [Tumebacillus permanentifrigoris]PWK07013.1 putative membrane protein DUF2339 [Tumebacillus permanentifrigoris]